MSQDAASGAGERSAGQHKRGGFCSGRAMRYSLVCFGEMADVERPVAETGQPSSHYRRGGAEGEQDELLTRYGGDDLRHQAAYISIGILWDGVDCLRRSDAVKQGINRLEARPATDNVANVLALPNRPPGLPPRFRTQTEQGLP